MSKQYKLYFDFVNAKIHDHPKTDPEDKIEDLLILTICDILRKKQKIERVLDEEWMSDFAQTRWTISKTADDLAQSMMNLLSYTMKANKLDELESYCPSDIGHPDHVVEMLEDLTLKMSAAEARQTDADNIAIEIDGDTAELPVDTIRRLMSVCEHFVDITSKRILGLPRFELDRHIEKSRSKLALMERDPSFAAMQDLVRLKYYHKFLKT